MYDHTYSARPPRPWPIAYISTNILKYNRVRKTISHRKYGQNLKITTRNNKLLENKIESSSRPGERGR